jgi:SIR2-like domain
MDDNLTTISYSIFNNKGVYALLLGSGISRSSGIPTGWDVVLDIIEQISVLKKEPCLPTPEEWFIKTFGEEPDYSNLLEKLTKTQEERLNLLRPYFEPSDEEIEEGLKQPTLTHKKIAQLVKQGFIKVIITTNFDRLLENSLKEIGVEAVVISNPNHIENTMPLIHNKITIIKINGDYLDTSFLNIKSELNSYDTRLVSLLNYIFENFGLITCGWSARWDLALVNILKSANKFRFSNYFSFINKPNQELVDLSDFRKGQLIGIKSSDSFFTEISESISALENNSTNHPLTPKIALARLKKYIVRDEYIISLNDLIRNETENVFDKINSINFPAPNTDEIKNVMDFYFSKIETIGLLLMNGVYWSKEIHHEIWTNTLIRLSSPTEKTNNYAVWSEIEYFPAMTLIYIIGLTCVKKNNFTLLDKITSIEINQRYETENILSLTSTSRVVDKRHLNQALGNKQYVPMSELLYNKLKTQFELYIPNEKDFENLFDYFEYLLALIYKKRMNDKWAPIGRFGYRLNSGNCIVKKRIEEQKSLGENSDLISSGLFNNTEEFEEILVKFQEQLKNVNYF